MQRDLERYYRDERALPENLRNRKFNYFLRLSIVSVTTVSLLCVCLYPIHFASKHFREAGYTFANVFYNGCLLNVKQYQPKDDKKMSIERVEGICITRNKSSWA